MKKLFCLLALASIIGCSKDDNEEPSIDEQLAIDFAIIDDYLLKNNISTEEHSSGIQFINLVDGEGDSPSLGDRAAVKIQFKLLDETLVFNDTLGLTIDLNDQIIQALRFMIPTMKEGGMIKFFAPSSYCFGSTTSSSIPANSNLIFTVELLHAISDENDQLEADTTIISEYLDEKDIMAEVHDSGIRFVVESAGTGDSPTIDDIVTVKYKGTFLNGITFDQSPSPVQFALTNLIDAWKIMIPTMKVGEKITIYCPSQYCYGTTGNNTIAPNTILVFEIDLESIN